MSENCNFRIYKSNKLENFLPEVCKIIRRLAEDAPLEKKSIVVQSDGMARWLTLKAAKEAGAFANFEFVSPDGFLRNFAEKYFEITPDSVYSKKNAEWALYSQLRNAEDGPAGKYIGGNEARAFRFSRTLADLLEQYFVYRPDMMRCWQETGVKTSDPDEAWQFGIFRELAQKTTTKGFAQLFMKKCGTAPAGKSYPKELILFGISIMNSYQLEMFRSLSDLFPVHIFAVSPSHEYFSVSKNKGAFDDAGDDRELSAENLPDTFFGRFCAAGLDFVDFTAGDSAEGLFEEPEGKTLLHSIQHDILNDLESPEKTENDDSVQIISCRDKMREIEVLKDKLLGLFKENDGLKPEDIAVMAPKINDYVPYITAVFGGTDPKDMTFVPWVISDRTFASESKIAATFLEILKTGRSDFEKSKVFSIFSSPYVCTKFNVDEQSVNSIEKLVGESGVRWGLDAESRGEDFGGSGQNTWDFGLSRIMMSFVMPFSENGKGFDDILPMASASKEDLDNVSGFITFAKELFRCSKQLFSFRRPPDEFKNLLEGMLDFFFVYDRNDKAACEEIRYIRKVIDDFAETAGKFTEDLSFDAVLQYLEDELGRERSGRGFLSSKVNFCSLKPLRALPFKVIYLIGMGDGDFPRTENRYAFDLTQKKSMKEPAAPSPRSVRDNDKYLFVEAVISARDKLFISYEARDLSEDSKKRRCAAMPVQILEQYIEKKTGVKAEYLETKYPVQPFSEEYFKDGKFKTFSKRDFDIAEVMFHVEQNRRDLQPARVSEQQNESCGNGGEAEVVELEKLISFFKEPAKYYFTKTLRIAIPDDKDMQEDEELFGYANADPLLKYNIRKTYIDMAKSMPEEFGKGPDEFNKLFVGRIKGEGGIPLGSFGEEELKGFAEDSNLYSVAANSVYKNFIFRDISLDFEDLSLKLQGRIKNIKEPGSMILVYPGGNKAKYRVEAMIRHLAANAAGLKVNTSVFFIDKTFMLEASDQHKAKEYLSWFMTLWKSGKSRVPFFDPDLIVKVASGKKKISDIPNEALSFFEKIWLERNSEYSYKPPWLVFAAEQFVRQKDRFVKEFPAEKVAEVGALLKKFYSSRKVKADE